MESSCMYFVHVFKSKHFFLKGSANFDFLSILSWTTSIYIYIYILCTIELQKSIHNKFSLQTSYTSWKRLLKIVQVFCQKSLQITKFHFGGSNFNELDTIPTWNWGPTHSWGHRPSSWYTPSFASSCYLIFFEMTENNLEYIVNPFSIWYRIMNYPQYIIWFVECFGRSYMPWVT